jgi:hypothetical protein
MSLKGSYFLAFAGFFAAFFADFLAAFFVAMSCHLLLADSIDSFEERVLA